MGVARDIVHIYLDSHIHQLITSWSREWTKTSLQMSTYTIFVVWKYFSKDMLNSCMIHWRDNTLIMHVPKMPATYVLHATPPKFTEKTFMALHKSAKFAKVFSLDSFTLYGNKELLDNHPTYTSLWEIIPYFLKISLPSNVTTYFSPINAALEISLHGTAQQRYMYVHVHYTCIHYYLYINCVRRSL